MKVTKFRGNQIVSIPIHKYRFDPDKKVSKGQKVLQDFLLKYVSPQFLYQELRVPGSLKRLDLFLITHKAVIEFSPKSHHGSFNPFFHKNRLNFRNSIVADMEKMNWCEKQGWKFIEIADEDLPKLSHKWFEEEFGIYL